MDIFKEWGFSIGLATNSPRSIVDVVVDKFQWHEVFDCTVSISDVDNGKPAPDVYLHALKLMDRTADRAIAIEDTHTGYMSATSAGLCTLLVNPHIQNIEGWTPRPTVILDSLKHINSDFIATLAFAWMLFFSTLPGTSD